MMTRLHAIPINDEQRHSAQAICWCHPTEVDKNVWAHNAKDCREARERITGTKASDGWVIVAEFVPPSAELDNVSFDIHTLFRMRTQTSCNQVTPIEITEIIKKAMGLI